MKKKIMDILLTDDVVVGTMFVVVITAISGLIGLSYELGKRDA